jgi:hypothetical protein
MCVCVSVRVGVCVRMCGIANVTVLSLRGCAYKCVREGIQAIACHVQGRERPPGARDAAAAGLGGKDGREAGERGATAQRLQLRLQRGQPTALCRHHPIKLATQTQTTQGQRERETEREREGGG